MTMPEFLTLRCPKCAYEVKVLKLQWDRSESFRRDAYCPKCQQAHRGDVHMEPKP